MAALIDWLTEWSRFVPVFQIILDLVLITCVIFFMLRRSEGEQKVAGVDSITESLEEVIKQTQTIAESFDKNLQERQVLIQQVLGKLDQRLAEAEQAHQKLQTIYHELKTSPNVQPPSRHSENQEIIRMAKKGLNAASIAECLHKPVGEVELVLKLQKISST